MGFGRQTLFVLLAAASGTGQSLAQTGASAISAPPSPSASPSPTPRYKFIPYGFESTRDRSAVPLLRFEDKAEVRSIEMNAAIARFFDRGDEKGNMLRGATPGGAPTLRDMAGYRPHVSPSVDLLGLAFLAVKEIGKQIRNHEAQKGDDLLRSLLLTPSPTPSPSPSPGAARDDG